MATIRQTTARLVGAAAIGTLLASTGATARPIEDILSSGILRSCVPTANPPDGQVIPENCTGYCGYEGVLGDLVEAFANSLDLETEYWVSSWDGLFHNADGVTDREGSYTPVSLATNKCDMVGAVMVSLDWRRKKMDMACFLPSRMMVVARTDRVGEFRSLEDLGGRTVSVERSMSMHSWVEQQNAGPLANNPMEIEFLPYDESIPAVDRGDVDFTVVSVLDALYHTRNIVENSTVAFAVGPIDEGCWGYEKGDTEMAALIETFFEEQTGSADSELNAIWESYYGISFADFIRLVSTIQ